MALVKDELYWLKFEIEDAKRMIRVTQGLIQQETELKLNHEKNLRKHEERLQKALKVLYDFENGKKVVEIHDICFRDDVT